MLSVMYALEVSSIVPVTLSVSFLWYLQVSTVAIVVIVMAIATAITVMTVGRAMATASLLQACDRVFIAGRLSLTNIGYNMM